MRESHLGGEFMGHPATGRSFSVQHIHLFRLRDGRLVDTGRTATTSVTLAQLGLLEELRNPQ